MLVHGSEPEPCKVGDDEADDEETRIFFEFSAPDDRDEPDGHHDCPLDAYGAIGCGQEELVEPIWHDVDNSFAVWFIPASGLVFGVGIS